jgi:hypothetical protein
MRAIKAVGLVLLALLVVGPAFADGRDHWRDRRGSDDRGANWVHRDRDHREWRRDRHRDWRPHKERRQRHWMYGFRGRDEERRVHRRWRHHDRHWHRHRQHDRGRRNVIIISPFGGIFGRFFD